MIDSLVKIALSIVLVLEIVFIVRMILRRRKLRFKIIQIDAHGGEVGQWIARKYFESEGTLKFLRVDDKEYVTVSGQYRVEPLPSEPSLEQELSPEEAGF